MAESDDAVPDETPDEDGPLGATSEVHRDLDPHDLPKDHPSRPAVEDAAETPTEDPRDKDVSDQLPEEQPGGSPPP